MKHTTVSRKEILDSSYDEATLGSVGMHRELLTAALRWIMALKLWSVLSLRRAMRLIS